jgi:glutamate transport system permease protein
MDFVVDQRSLILEGFWTTVRLAAVSGVLSLVLGTALAIMRVCPIPPLRWAGAVYVTVLRNTPLTLVFVFSTFGLPRLDIRFSFFTFAVIALSSYTSAFVCEAVRSGINSVAPGEIEAARSVGLPFAQTLRLVVLPQAFRAVIPPLSSVFIALTKNTSIAVAFSVAEATSILRRLQNQDASATFPLLLTTAAGYLVLTLAISFVFSRLERRVAVAR